MFLQNGLQTQVDDPSVIVQQFMLENDVPMSASRIHESLYLTVHEYFDFHYHYYGVRSSVITDFLNMHDMIDSDMFYFFLDKSSLKEMQEQGLIKVVDTIFNPEILKELYELSDDALYLMSSMQYTHMSDGYDLGDYERHYTMLYNKKIPHDILEEIKGSSFMSKDAESFLNRHCLDKSDSSSDSMTKHIQFI